YSRVCVVFLLTPRSPGSTLFPYTTLFRSWYAAGQGVVSRLDSRGSALSASLAGAGRRFNYELDYNDRSAAFRVLDGFVPRVDIRSEEHTSELQSRFDLVCRLLLEKKNIKP